MTTQNYPGANVYRSGAQGPAVGAIPTNSGSTVVTVDANLPKKIVVPPVTKQV